MPEITCTHLWRITGTHRGRARANAQRAQANAPLRDWTISLYNHPGSANTVACFHGCTLFVFANTGACFHGCALFVFAPTTTPDPQTQSHASWVHPFCLCLHNHPGSAKTVACFHGCTLFVFAFITTPDLQTQSHALWAYAFSVCPHNHPGCANTVACFHGCTLFVFAFTTTPDLQTQSHASWVHAFCFCLHNHPGSANTVACFYGCTLFVCASTTTPDLQTQSHASMAHAFCLCFHKPPRIRKRSRMLPWVYAFSVCPHNHPGCANTVACFHGRTLFVFAFTTTPDLQTQSHASMGARFLSLLPQPPRICKHSRRAHLSDTPATPYSTANPPANAVALVNLLHCIHGHAFVRSISARFPRHRAPLRTHLQNLLRFHGHARPSSATLPRHRTPRRIYLQKPSH